MNLATDRISNAVAGAAVALAAVLAAVGTFAEHADNAAREFLVVLVVIALAAAAVFGWIVPRALAKGGSGRVAITLSLLGLATVAVFWSGLPLVLAAGGAVLGWAGRSGARGATLARGAVAIAVLALVADVVVFVGDAASVF